MKIDLSQQVTMAGVRKTLASFWFWWTSEICHLFPRSWQERVQIWFASPRVTLSDGVWTLSAGGQLRDLPFGREMDGATAPDLLQSVGLVDVELPSESVLRRVVFLPRVAAARMHPAVALQIERLSPFRAEEVAFDCLQQIRDASSGQITVDVAVAPIGALQELECALADLGLSVGSFVTEAGHRFPASKWNWRRDINFMAGISVAAGVLLCIIAFALAPTLREAEIENQRAHVASLKSAATEAVNAKIALDDLAVSAELLAQKNRAPSALDVLENLTLAVPSDVQLTQLEFDGHRVRMVGVTDNIRLLVGALKHSNWVATIHLNQQVSPSGKRFEIELTAR